MNNPTTCAWCGGGLPQRATSLCSPTCRKAKQRQQARENSRRARAEGTAKSIAKTCTHCQATFKTDRHTTKLCSRACRDKANVEAGHIQRAAKAAGQASKRRAKPKPPRPAPRDTRSPLTRALDAGDNDQILRAIEGKCQKRDECWEWHGRGSGGYAEYRYKGRSLAVHRVSLEAKLGLKLGKQAAHHMCANTICVNPDHLQPVSHRENIAEMLERKFYRDRIKELEAALAELTPDHELLSQISLD